MTNGCSASCGRHADRGEAGSAPVEELDARRRLLVGELEVGQLPEVRERAAPVRAARLGVGDQRGSLPTPSRTTYEVLKTWLESVA